MLSHLFFMHRTWNFIEVNVTRAELKEALFEQISHLVYPLETILDESLGAALWFAARGIGHVSEIPYTTQCRVGSHFNLILIILNHLHLQVLLIGSGADELFGGYTRHRNAFTRYNNSWVNLDSELNLDWVRLPGRNLGRDDRVIADHGITARSPFVQEDLSAFVRNLKASQKCYHFLEHGVGDKLLLRLCAYRLGLANVCSMKKRALQFGSRVADSKQNAKDKSKHLAGD